MKRFTRILFDLDGTLTASAPGITKSVQYALKSIGIDEQDQRRLESFIGPPLHEQFRKSYGFDDALADQLVAEFRKRYDTIGKFEANPYPGIPELLRDLHESGRVIGVASSKPEIMARQVIEHFKIAQYMDFICGASLGAESEHMKGVDHKVVVMKKAIETAGGTDHCAMVGDRLFDIEGAVRTGISPVGAAYGYGTREELLQAGCPAEDIADSPEELRKILMQETSL